MRNSPSFEMTVRHFGVWFAGVGLMVGLAAAALATWWVASPVTAPALASAAAFAVVCIVAAVSAAREVRPTRLRWDGRCWFAAPAGVREGVEPVAVELGVTIDFGRWMLLRLRPAQAPRWHRAVWLPAQRRGHEAHWHALRCAVYSPRPAPGGPPVAEP